MKLITATPKEQLAILKKGIVNLVSEEDLLKKLESSYAKQIPLKIKLGADPSRPDLHLGHTVVLNKLKEFMEFNHEVIFIIGNFTAMIGDPSGKNKTRPNLTLEESKKNAMTYKEQISKVLDINKIKLLFNYDWLHKLTIHDMLNILSKVSLNNLIKRDDFSNRLKNELPIATHELIYPILQGYDSIELRADVEIGGTDQLFNLLLGRDLQRSFNIEPQVTMTMPLLEGLDGVLKMSKSSDNYIGLTEDSTNFFGKLMSISDTLMLRYYDLLYPSASKKDHPMEAKKDLAEYITGLYHGKDCAKNERISFEKRFSKKEIPADLEEISIKSGKIDLIELFKSLNWCQTNSEVRRLLKQNALKINGEVVRLEKISLEKGIYILKLGKLKMTKLITS